MSVQYTYTPRTVIASKWGEFFLDRLDRLTKLTPEVGARFNAEQLLHHAIYSSYLDCREHGTGEAAQAVLDRARARGAKTPGQSW